MLFIGIDPGKSGGIAVLHSTGGIIDVRKMPDTEQDILDLLRITHGVPARAVLEQVHPGVFGAAKFGQRMGVVSAWTFGKGYGALRMALVSLQIPFTEVVPAKWQQAMGCRTKGDKNISKRRAQELFPAHPKITHAIADCLLIAEYCRLQERIP